MMVTSTFLTGQQEPPKFLPKTAMPSVKNGKGHLPYNGDTSKTYDLSSALALATSISNIQR